MISSHSQEDQRTHPSIHSPTPTHPLRDVIVACAYNQTSPRDKSESHAERETVGYNKVAGAAGERPLVLLCRSLLFLSLTRHTPTPTHTYQYSIFYRVLYLHPHLSISIHPSHLLPHRVTDRQRESHESSALVWYLCISALPSLDRSINKHIASKQAHTSQAHHASLCNLHHPSLPVRSSLNRCRSSLPLESTVRVSIYLSISRACLLYHVHQLIVIVLARQRSPPCRNPCSRSTSLLEHYRSLVTATRARVAAAVAVVVVVVARLRDRAMRSSISRR